jgi:hypothetical protein
MLAPSPFRLVSSEVTERMRELADLRLDQRGARLLVRLETLHHAAGAGCDRR